MKTKSKKAAALSFTRGADGFICLFDYFAFGFTFCAAVEQQLWWQCIVQDSQPPPQPQPDFPDFLSFTIFLITKNTKSAIIRHTIIVLRFALSHASISASKNL